MIVSTRQGGDGVREYTKNELRYGREECEYCKELVPVMYTMGTMWETYICDVCLEHEMGEDYSVEEITEELMLPKPNRIKLNTP